MRVRACARVYINLMMPHAFLWGKKNDDREIEKLFAVPNLSISAPSIILSFILFTLSGIRLNYPRFGNNNPGIQRFCEIS